MDGPATEQGARVTISRHVFDLDWEHAADGIAAALRDQVLSGLRKKGLVVGLSGGIDSSLCAALAVRALGRERVFGLLMPERDSSDESERYARILADELGIEST